MKAQNRTAILDAARSLLSEAEGDRFSVDRLAERADVARRTIFNHFDSLDEVLLAIETDALAVVVDDFLRSVSGTAVGDGSRAAMFDELARALHRSDLPRAIAALAASTRGDLETLRRHRADLTRIALARVGARLGEEVARRHPSADGFDVDLLVASLVNGLAVVANRWVGETGGALDSASYAVWEQLLTRLLHSLRAGYMPT